MTPTTTAQELIFSATNILSQSVSRDAAILRETYTAAGLERRVRRYEHVRDIMNSWDRDTQNTLELTASDSPRHDTDLWPQTAPRHRPDEFTAQMHHSHKPGRWVKSYVTLMPTGQIYAHRKAGAKLSDKDTTPLCHISDFDVYAPIPTQMRKLQPPKKHCCAIKSQQKATMFLSVENFVHFFCTDDKFVADAFHDAVQRWRSWYLLSTTAKVATKSPTSAPYQLGSFEPLSLSISSASSPPASTTNSETTRQIPFHLRHSMLPPRDSPPTSSPDEPFSPTSLLGPTYSMRARAAALRDANSANPDFGAGPFIPGPSLLNAAATSPSDDPGVLVAEARLTRGLSTSTKSRSRSGTMTRPDAVDPSAPPVPGIPAPLLEFKAEFVEAPQWRAEGKGRGVEAPRGVPLVEVAGRGGTDKAAGGGLERSGTLFRRQ